MGARRGEVLRPCLALAAVFWALAASAPAALHRMPEVYVAVEESDLDGKDITAVTVRLEAEDAYLIAASAYGHDVRLADDRSRQLIAQRVRRAIVSPTEGITSLGVEIDGDLVFVYLAGPADARIVETRILASVHESWTNYVRDTRGDEPVTRMFTQRGPMADHRH